MIHKIMIQVDDEIVEATGDALQEILDAQAAEAVRLQEELAATAIKNSAIAKLAKLGLTEDEAKAIVGVN